LAIRAYVTHRRQRADFETPQHAEAAAIPKRYDYPYGIIVNALGLRFFDEGEAQHSFTYARPAGRARQRRDRLSDYDQDGLKCRLPAPAAPS